MRVLHFFSFLFFLAVFYSILKPMSLILEVIFIASFHLFVYQLKVASEQQKHKPCNFYYLSQEKGISHSHKEQRYVSGQHVALYWAEIQDFLLRPYHFICILAYRGEASDRKHICAVTCMSNARCGTHHVYSYSMGLNSVIWSHSHRAILNDKGGGEVMQGEDKQGLVNH